MFHKHTWVKETQSTIVMMTRSHRICKHGWYFWPGQLCVLSTIKFDQVNFVYSPPSQTRFSPIQNKRHTWWESPFSCDTYYEFGVLYITEQKYLMGPTSLKTSSNSEGILKPLSGDNSVHPSFTGMEVPLKPDNHMFHKPTWVHESFNLHVQGPHTRTTSEAYHVVTQEWGYLSPQSSRKHGERLQTRHSFTCSYHSFKVYVSVQHIGGFSRHHTEKCTTSTRHPQYTHHRSWRDPSCSCPQLPCIPLPPAALVIVLFSFAKPSLTWFLFSKRFADLFRVRNWGSIFFEGNEKLWFQAWMYLKLFFWMVLIV
jgi:hypothetical protein